MNYKEKFKNLPRTPWFLGSVKPHRIGVYERYFDQTGILLFCYWDGEHWLAGLNPLFSQILTPTKDVEGLY